MSSFSFSNKRVFIISPERWGKMKVSKHHYAIELAKRNSEVYFIEPPDLNNPSLSVEPSGEDSRINIVRYSPVFRGKHYLPLKLYQILLRIQIGRLIKKLGKPDVVWCFQGYLFHNLKWFGTEKTIFFAADQFSSEDEPSELSTADLVLCVSDTIFERAGKCNSNTYRINHGLQQSFAAAAEALLKSNHCKKPANNLVVGYVGNLMMEAMDRRTMQDVIEANPGIKFIFWGAYKKEDGNLGGSDSNEASQFISFLEQSHNVELRGVVASNELQKQMRQADVFWLCWKLDTYRLWDGSNSHKILEYLSTGCPVVSHYVSSYKDSDLFYMLPGKSNDGFKALFAECIQKIKVGEDPGVIKRRLEWAVLHSYTQQLDRIEKLLSN